MSEKLKEQINDSSISKFNCVFNSGKFVATLKGNDNEIEFQEIKCHIDFIFHPELKENEKKINCYFNLEELTKVLKEGIQYVSGTYYSVNVDVEEFYNAEQESIELHKKYPSEMLYSIKSSDLDKDLLPVDIFSPRKEVLQKIVNLLKKDNSSEKKSFDPQEKNLENFKIQLQAMVENTTYKYFQTRSIFHNKSFIDEVIDTLNEIAEKDYDELENILM